MQGRITLDDVCWGLYELTLGVEEKIINWLQMGPDNYKGGLNFED